MEENLSDAPLLVRIPMPLKMWLRRRADENFSSMSREIVQLLTKLKQETEAK